MALNTYVPRPQPTLGDNDQLYLQAELAGISGSIKSVTDEIKAIEGAWTAYTPTVSSGTGTITTKSATGRYRKVGKTVFVQISITITTNGTGAGAVLASLPLTPYGSVSYVISGRENGVGGKMLQGLIGNGNGTTMNIFNYDNSYPGGNGYVLHLSGVYECA